MLSPADTPPPGSHSAAEERLRKINAFTISLLQQHNLDDLLWSIVENVGNLLGFEDCVIYLLEGDILVQAASFAANDPGLRNNRRDFKLLLGEGIVGTVAATGEPRIVRDTREEPDYIRDDFSGLSELAVPIFFEEKVIGALDTESRRADAYGETELTLLQSIANIAASRIASALADEERKKLVAQLEAKNTELERFTYTVSHDLKSPLITILGFVGLLENDTAEGNSERVARDIERIRTAAQGMGRLLDDLLALSRVGRMRNPSIELNLSEIANEAVARVAGRIHAGNVQVKISPELPAAFGDRERLLQVFQNLVENAVKFMGDPAEPMIEIGQRVEGSDTVCFVRDNGIGIDPSHHERIFGLFERLDRAQEGTGLGLTLAQRIVEIHDGRIWVESEGEGCGSTFCLYLPPPSASKR